MTVAPAKPARLPRELDPRNPVTRLTSLVDPGTLELITPDNLSGMVAARGRISVTGPDVVRSVTGEDVDMLRLGGPEPHGRRSGVVHITTDSEAAALEQARRLTDLLANQGTMSTAIPDTDLSGFLPESAKRA